MITQSDMGTRQRFSALMSTCSIIGAIMVVWIHTYNVEVYSDSNRVIFWLQEAVSAGIARAAVPFFLVSSAFFLYSKDKTIREVYQSRAKSLLIPYLLWNTAYMIAFAVLRYLALTNTGMETITIENVTLGIIWHKYNYTYWFMRDLIIYVALYPLIRWLLGRGKVLAFTVLTALCIACCLGAEFLDSAIFYLIGAIIGYYYREQAETVVCMDKKRQTVIVILCLFVGVLLFWLKNVCKIDQLIVFRDFTMTLILFFVVNRFNIRITGAFAGLSFMIYSLHPLILEMIEKSIYLFFPHNDLWMMIDYIAAPIICLALIVGICFLWKKCLPKVYQVFNGGRL